jgi:hypothetical protein
MAGGAGGTLWLSRAGLAPRLLYWKYLWNFVLVVLLLLLLLLKKKKKQKLHIGPPWPLPPATASKSQNDSKDAGIK